MYESRQFISPLRGVRLQEYYDFGLTSMTAGLLKRSFPDNELLCPISDQTIIFLLPPRADFHLKIMRRRKVGKVSLAMFSANGQSKSSQSLEVTLVKLLKQRAKGHNFPDFLPMVEVNTILKEIALRNNPQE